MLNDWQISRYLSNLTQQLHVTTNKTCILNNPTWQCKANIMTSQANTTNHSVWFMPIKHQDCSKPTNQPQHECSADQVGQCTTSIMTLQNSQSNHIRHAHTNKSSNSKTCLIMLTIATVT